MPAPFKHPFAMLLALALFSAHNPLSYAGAQPNHPIGLTQPTSGWPPVSPITFAAVPLRLDLRARVPAPASGAVYATLRPGERPRAVAQAYGQPPAALGVDPDVRVRGGSVVKLPLTVERAGRRLPPGVTPYTVRAGDTLGAIAARFGLEPLDLVSANLDTASLDDVVVGQDLLVPTAERGLLLRLKPGQDLLGLLRVYRADVVQVARVNALDNPFELRSGDYLLLPGVQARGLWAELQRRRQRALVAARQQRVLAQYERFLTYQQGVRERQRQAARARQAQYERYLAYQRSPERRALQASYDRQAKYEAYLETRRQQAIAAAQASVKTGKVAAVAAGDPVLRRAAFGDASIVRPLHSAVITSRFGEQDIEFHKQHFHGGVDFAAPSGTPIYAAVSGTVQQSGYGDFGLNVWTQHAGATLIYGHMSRTAVSVGQQVEQGQLLGYVGCTGFCTGPHLHFEVRLDGQAVDPLALLP